MGLTAHFAAVLCLVSISGIAAEDSEAPDWTALIEAFDPLAESHMKAERVPGMAVAVIQNRRVVVEKFYGHGNLKLRTPIGPTSGFGVASVSKMFTAWGVMRLVEQGKLDLDKPVGSYLKRWKLPESRYSEEKVTLRRLLSHTAGYDMSGEWHYPVDRPIPSLLDSVKGEVSSPLRLRLMHEPGTQMRYSGSNYAVVQLIVEEIVGKPFMDYMRESVLRPLGLKHSDYDFTPEIARRVVTSHNPADRVIVHHRAIAPAAGSIHTTLRDLETFALGWFPGLKGEPIGRGVIRPESFQLVTTPAPQTNGGYGLGYQVKKAMPGVTVIGSTGGTRGWVCEVYMIAESGDGLILLTNSTSGVGVTQALHNEWVGRLVLKEIARRSSSTQVANAFTKSFYGTWRGTIEGAGDGTRTIPFKLTLTEADDGKVSGTYRADHWDRDFAIHVSELTPDKFRARIVSIPGSFFDGQIVGQGLLSGDYYEDGTMTFSMRATEWDPE